MNNLSIITGLSFFLVFMSCVHATIPSNLDIFELERDTRADARTILNRFAKFVKPEEAYDAVSRSRAVNPYNACIWKICSRPLKNRNKFEKAKEVELPVANQKTVVMLSELLKKYDLGQLTNNKKGLIQ